MYSVGLSMSTLMTAENSAMAHSSCLKVRITVARRLEPSAAAV
jgi:hypothetical protein